MAQLLLGKEVTASLNEEIRRKVAQLNEQGVTPKLGIVRIGEREDDISYERGATKRCETLGVAFEKFLLPADASEEEVLQVIRAVNEDDSIHGVLLFRPLPRHLNEDRIVNALAVEKDVDGITDLSMASVFMGRGAGYAPCTPSACMRILHEQYHDKVPEDFNALLKLPGVGRKSANLIMGDVFGKPAIVTDTHCIRLSNRIGLVHDMKDPKKVEMALWKIIPPEEGNDLCHRLVNHGREVCTARTKPYCDRCCLNDICEKNGI